jgi:hypothetical protein
MAAPPTIGFSAQAEVAATKDIVTAAAVNMVFGKFIALFLSKISVVSPQMLKERDGFQKSFSVRDFFGILEQADDADN